MTLDYFTVKKECGLHITKSCDAYLDLTARRRQHPLPFSMSRNEYNVDLDAGARSIDPALVKPLDMIDSFRIQMRN